MKSLGLSHNRIAAVGRKRILTPTPVKQKALSYNIPVFQPEKIKEDYQTVLDWNPDLIITAALVKSSRKFY